MEDDEKPTDGPPDNDSGSAVAARSNGVNNVTTILAKKRKLGGPAQLTNEQFINQLKQLVRLPAPTPMNVVAKYIPFLSDFATIGVTTNNYMRAWSAYQGHAPIGWGGNATYPFPMIGYTYDGSGSYPVYVSNDYSLLLTNIPMESTPSNNIYYREGPSIYIRKVYGKAIITRSPVTVMEGVNKNLVATSFPRVMSYLQRTPVSLQVNSANTDTGQGSVLMVTAYPAPDYAQTTQASNCDFVSYVGQVAATASSNTAPEPNGGAPWSYRGSIARFSPLEYVHPSPGRRNEVLCEHREHLVSKMSASVVDTATNGTVATSQLFPNNTGPAQIPPKTFEIPLTHTFHGKGMRVDYDPLSTSGTSAIVNQLRWKLHFDMTGTFWDGTILAAGAANVWCHGYSDTLSFQIWVEFNDAPSELEEI